LEQEAIPRMMPIIKRAEDNMYRRKLLEQKSSHSAIVSSIRAAMLARSQETEEHAERLTSWCRQLGQVLGLKQTEIDNLLLLATLHDIGKMGIDDAILNKPGKLTEEEWIMMRKHPEIGYRIAMSSPDLIHIADYILSHHERWDGTGYPQGLCREKIPLLSRAANRGDGCAIRSCQCREQNCALAGLKRGFSGFAVV
jgi:HD-GYP domain-containing protein (c-di-GMP phosphodiesterase class II)